MSKSLQATSASWLIISIAHAVSAKDWRTGVKYNALPPLAKTCATAGWYQGSGFFIMNCLINFAWSKNPEALQDPLQKAIATMMIIIMGTSSAWYAKNGVNSNAAAVALVTALQTYATFKA